MRDALLGLLQELRNLWPTLAAAMVVFGSSAVGLIAWLLGIDISVTNESMRDLSRVQLVTYGPEGDRDVVWSEDLDRREGEWRYIFTGAHGVALQFEIEGERAREACEFDSQGIGRSVKFTIRPDGAIWCRSSAPRA